MTRRRPSGRRPETSIQEVTEDDRSQLRFEEGALAAFAFLRSDYGLVPVASGPYLVRYEAAWARVDILHRRNSYEVVVNVGPAAPPGTEAYSIWEIARLHGAPDVNERTFLQASTAAAVAAVLTRLADTLRTYGKAALQGDSHEFALLRELRVHESEQFQALGHLSWVREQVARAWAERDFAAVVKLLSSISGLSEADAAKLAFAKRHLHVDSE
jgi:hypothetical protein